MLAVTVLLAALCGQQMFGTALELSEVHEYFTTCATETGATKDEMLTWAEGGGNASDNLKCQMKCILIKENVLMGSGELRLENFLAARPVGQHGFIKECAEIDRGDDLCDFAYRNQLCIRGKNPAFYAERIKMIAAAN